MSLYMENAPFPINTLQSRLFEISPLPGCVLQVMPDQFIIRHPASQHDVDGWFSLEAGCLVGCPNPISPQAWVAIEEETQTLVDRKEMSDSLQRFDSEPFHTKLPPAIDG